MKRKGNKHGKTNNKNRFIDRSSYKLWKTNFVSVTASYYDWAMKKLKAHKKNCAAMWGGKRCTLWNPREYFYERLDHLFPQLKEKYMRIYGNQYMVKSPHNNQLMSLFYQKCNKAGIVHSNEQIFQYLHTFEEKETAKQLSLWDMGMIWLIPLLLSGLLKTCVTGGSIWEDKRRETGLLF